MKEALPIIGIGVILLVLAAVAAHRGLVPPFPREVEEVRVLKPTRSETAGYLSPGGSVTVEMHVKIRYEGSKALVCGDVKTYPKGIGMGQVAYIAAEGTVVYLVAGGSRFPLADLSKSTPSEIVAKVKFAEARWDVGMAYQTWVYWNGEWVKTAQWLGGRRTVAVVVGVAECNS